MKSNWCTCQQWSFACLLILEAVEDDDEDVDKDEAKYKVVDKDEAEYKGVNERSLHSFHRQSNSPRREIPFDTRPSAAFVEYFNLKIIVFIFLYRIFQFQIHISILSSNIFPSIICLSPDLANFFDLKFLFAILIWIYLLRGEWNICPHNKYLIFWIVMGCGIAGFGRSGLKTT